MVIFWVVLGLIALTIFIMAIDKKHHKITIKEQQAITTTTKNEIKEQKRRYKTKHNGIMNAEKLK